MNGRAEIQSLTGLRGVAALLIVWCHWGVWMRPVTSTLPPVLGSLFGTDGIAMTMFFVLSGFVIAYNYARFDWHTNPLQSLGLFFIHRFARLYPLYLLFILYTIWLYSGVFTVAKFDSTLRRELITTLLGIQSWLPFTNSNGALAIDNEFNISWSISTEFFLYITFAIMMLICRSFRLRFIAAYFVISFLLFFALNSSVAFSLSHLPTDTYSKWLHQISPFCRMFEFGAGMLACWVVINTRSGYLLHYASVSGVLLLFFIWLSGTTGINLPGGHAVIIAGVLLMVAGSTDQNRVNAFLSHSAIVYAGLISYSIYLFHILPTNLIGGRHLIQANESAVAMLGDAMQIYLFNFVLGLIILFALATGLYRGVEMPARRFIRGFIQC